MSELIDREALKDAVKRYAGEPIKEKDRKCQAICLDMLGTIDAQPAASPWHRVEEPPKESGKQYVVWASKGYAYCDKWLGDRWLISSVAPETVTHWMPIEPPKEDA